ncbi:MAG TPA: hypothetical protein VGF99_17760 [Myxococcota bacterium]
MLPTEGTGDVAREAATATSMMVGAIERESLALAPPAQVEAAKSANAAACAQSIIACARLVGGAVGASKVIVSELWGGNGAPWELRLTLVDVKASGEPKPMQSFTTEKREEVGVIAEREALALIGQGEQGWLSVTLQGADTGTLFVDGLSAGAFPFPAPVRMRTGQHSIEVKSGDATPYAGDVVVMKNETTKVGVHVEGNRIVLDGAAGPSPLFVAGLVTAGVGVAGVVVGGVTLVLRGTAVERYRADPTTANAAAIGTLQTVSGAAFIGGAALVIAGTTLAIVGAQE